MCEKNNLDRRHMGIKKGLVCGLKSDMQLTHLKKILLEMRLTQMRSFVAALSPSLGRPTGRVLPAKPSEEILRSDAKARPRRSVFSGASDVILVGIGLPPRRSHVSGFRPTTGIPAAGNFSQNKFDKFLLNLETLSEVRVKCLISGFEVDNCYWKRINLIVNFKCLLTVVIVKARSKA